jgi:chloramphenicol-sensitive protein RarD
VLFQAVTYKVIPWMPLGLALTFGLYGLLRKTVAVDSVTGTFLETLYLLPVTLVFLGWEALRGVSALGTADAPTHLFLVLAGLITAVPLVWFASGARLIPLSMVGFLQYLTPTLHLLIGVLLYREPFTHANLIGFGLIWLGILVFLVSTAVARGKRVEAAAAMAGE